MKLSLLETFARGAAPGPWCVGPSYPPCVKTQSAGPGNSHVIRCKPRTLIRCHRCNDGVHQRCRDGKGCKS
jgi:hypothetical protein